MKFEDNLTNEILLNNCTSNQFELVKEAITLAKHYVLSGRDLDSYESSNLASQVLNKMAYGENDFDDMDDDFEELAIERRVTIEKRSREFVNPSDLESGGKKFKGL